MGLAVEQLDQLAKILGRRSGGLWIFLWDLGWSPSRPCDRSGVWSGLPRRPLKNPVALAVELQNWLLPLSYVRGWNNEAENWCSCVSQRRLSLRELCRL